MKKTHLLLAGLLVLVLLTAGYLWARESAAPDLSTMNEDLRVKITDKLEEHFPPEERAALEE